MPKHMPFVIGKLKFVTFGLFSDAHPPRPNAICTVKWLMLCKGHLGSRGNMVVQAKEDTKHLTNINLFANSLLYCASTVYTP